MRRGRLSDGQLMPTLPGVSNVILIVVLGIIAMLALALVVALFRVTSSR